MTRRIANAIFGLVYRMWTGRKLERDNHDIW
jgi:hypothetical protein